MIIPIPVIMMILLALMALFILGIQIAYHMGAKKSAAPPLIKKQESPPESSPRSFENIPTSQMTPFSKDFPFSPSECHFIGHPVDFIVFEGMNQGRIHQIVFAGKNSEEERNSLRKSLIQTIQRGKIYFHPLVKESEASQDSFLWDDPEKLDSERDFF